MKHLFLIPLSLTFLLSCTSQEFESQITNQQSVVPSKTDKYYETNKGDDTPSISKGSVSSGSLENGKLMPFSGKNFQYFDTASYLGGRGYVNDKVKKTVLSTYELCETEIPNRRFFIMECSNQKGGKIWPHKTHQNGLSIDFMMPLKKGGEPYYGLDTRGATHYMLEFDYEGHYMDDPSIEIDFEVIAHHLLLLDKEAKKNGMHIKKVIIHTELKDELFAGKYGQQLKNSDIYVVKALTPLINALHDDHYHVDFEKL